ncbi:hypothetical protein [Anaeromyxobacter oryzae]|uniref:Uncharacterized protein n=1 Tax=Anaeromyxobacter oryzae TaxID=2918170 RepID=A0ABM7WPL3_9BACT|nr:hypothetical protein [Anaeromyxobacter oryzae]BDG01412.1 hypothetical protein AMOR_04080 [Anaeromyxobacter oryzae]
MFPRTVSAAAVAPPDPTPDLPGSGPIRRAEARAADRLEPGVHAAPLSAVASRPPSDPVSLAGLAACVGDARAAALSPADGPPDPATFAALRARLEKARAKLPPEYQRAVVDPLLRTLDGLGPRGFARVLAEDPEREGDAALLLDVAQAVLQHGEGYQARATSAFQEVVSDLYEGFLSAEDRRGVKPPDRGVLPPLVRWGSAEDGPYTWSATATASLEVGAPIVSLPAANASGGLLAWPALAHETAGHDILEADDGLRDELAGAVRDGLLAERMDPSLADYWADRIDETAADVLGVLNMGPAAAVGLVGYFRALNGAWNGTPSLRNVGSPEDPHPADIARAYLAAETVRLLSFKGAARWADRLVAEADRDLGRIRLGDLAVTAGVAKASAAVVARAIVRTRLGALEGRALGDIQDWRDADEAIVADLRRALKEGEGSGGAGRYAEGAYAAHAVAAGVYEAVAGTSDPAKAMSGMIGVLAEMSAATSRGDLAA